MKRPLHPQPRAMMMSPTGKIKLRTTRVIRPFRRRGRRTKVAPPNRRRGGKTVNRALHCKQNGTRCSTVCCSSAGSTDTVSVRSLKRKNDLWRGSTAYYMNCNSTLTHMIDDVSLYSLSSKQILRGSSAW